VGLLKDLSKMTTKHFKSEGDAILLVGGHGTHLGQSIYLREILGREEGAPPPVDLLVEKKNGDFVRTLINNNQLTAVHDISDGGLVTAIIEMALPTLLGATIDDMTHEHLFSEDQARYVLTCKVNEATKILAAGMNVIQIGIVTAEPELKIGTTEIQIAELKSAHEAWFPNYMAS
jgi:phosphoribosylformylglycinamidine synthase subunit PurL